MLLCMACSAYGQGDSQGDSQGDTTRYRFFFGPFGAFGGGLELVSLVPPGNFPDCGTLRDGSALEWAAGGLFEIPFSPSFALQLRGEARGFDGTLTGRLPSGLVARVDDDVVDVEIDHEVGFSGIALEGSLLARLLLIGRLHAQGGFAIGRWIGDEQSYKQRVVSPSDFLFANGSREFELISSDVFRTATIIPSVKLGLAYDLPISRHSTLSPELTASIPITSQTPDGPWRSLSLRAGAALRFGVARTPPPLPPSPDTPQVVVHHPALVTAIATEPRIVTVRIDERDSIEWLSLLNQLYFTPGSSELREPYRRLTPDAVRAFSDTTLTGLSALDVYYDILNIVGYRMRERRRDATLTINGYRSGTESGNAISRARAESVRRYLIETWGIAPERIKVKGGALPPSPSRENTREGIEENARVELVASDPNVLGPIRRHHIISTATPPAVTFYPQALAEAGVAQWVLEVVADGKGAWRTFTGEGIPPDSIVWNWRSDEGELPALPMRLAYTLSVTDSSGRATTTAVTEIEVAYHSVRKKLEHRENDTTIETYSLLLFNFDSPKVSATDSDLLELIATLIKPDATVRLIGYTDSLGDASHNYELAMQRARDVMRILKRALPSDVSIIIDERGGEHERFPYTTPEGRSHCRTVFIEVRTPTVPDGS